MGVPCWKKEGHLASHWAETVVDQLVALLPTIMCSGFPPKGGLVSNPFCQIPRRDLYNQNHMSHVLQYMSCVFFRYRYPFYGVLGWETRKATSVMGLPFLARCLQAARDTPRLPAWRSKSASAALLGSPVITKSSSWRIKDCGGWRNPFRS